MNLRIFTLFVGIFIPLFSYAQTDSLSIQDSSQIVTNKVVLIGDAGYLVNGKAPVLSAARRNVVFDNKTTVLYLGDNLYDDGLPDENEFHYAHAREILDSQLAINNGTEAKVVMIPGNHDWENGTSGGWITIQRMQSIVDMLNERNVEFQPKNGCPGPVEIELSDDVVLVVFDSQWWLHPYDKPGIESDCDQKTKDELTEELNEVLRKNFNKLVLLACHHPFRSNGIHGGYFGLKQHIFPFTDLRKKLYIPLPVIGSIYPITRSVFGTPQDVQHPVYQELVEEVTAVAKTHPNLIFLHGHEHNMQLLTDTSSNFIISGSGCKHTRVEPSRYSQYVVDSLGFVLLETYANKDVKATFYLVDGTTGDASVGFSKVFYNYSKIPELPTAVLDTMIPVYEDRVEMQASKQYANPSSMQEFMIGSNYRHVWEQKVSLPVFNLRRQGFKILKMGGGKQTKSLTLADANGKEWALRTIDKDPQSAIPENLRTGLAKDIVQDAISAANPYAPLIIPKLAEAVGVPHTNPKYFVVPEDDAFGYYKPLFANRMVMLEEKDATYDGSETKSTPKVMDKMLEDNTHVVLQNEVLKARLLDFWLADWDRHADQWRWGTVDTGTGKLYYPIPKDRDQALFHSDGKLMWWVARKRLPFLKGLRENIPDIEHLGLVAKDFDRLFLNEIDEPTWSNITANFISNVPDSVIDKAVADLPPEIYSINGDFTKQRLKSRRDDLQNESLKYYEFISRKVNVLGTNERDFFTISTDSAGQVVVAVNSFLKDGDTSFKRYYRAFDPKVTSEVRLYGFNEKDRFLIDPSYHSKTRIRIVGGKDVDTFDVRGKAKTWVYDHAAEQNVVSGGSYFKNKMEDNPEVNYFDSREFQYPIRKLARINLGFNGDDGIMLGLGAWSRTHGFRKTPYRNDQKLNWLYAPSQGAYQIKYKGDFIHILGKNDIYLRAEFVNPVLNNFFGFGNETRFDKNLGRQFYRVRYKTINGDVLLKRKIGRVITVTAGPTFYYYWNKVDRNKDYIFGDPNGYLDFDSSTIYSKKMYAGGKLGILIDNVNNEFFPTRGVNWYTEFSSLQPTMDRSYPLTKLESHMTVYASLNQPTRLVTVIRLGGGHIFSKNFEFFQALNMGANNYLRGFRKNRFSGNGMAYANLEFRYKLFDSKFYVLPGSVGLIGFNDVGRVWYRNERSNKWHNTIGGGLYYAPYNMAIVSATLGVSQEDQVFNFTIGTKFNLTF